MPGTFAKIWAWQFGQTLGTFKHIGNVGNAGNVPHVSDVPDVPLHIYIYRYLANKQLFFLAVNTFIHWIFNVMFNPVYHHCHPFTDFYKKFTCAEPKPFFIVRKSDTFILWRACLLVVPVGLDPRTYSIGTLQLEFFFLLLAIIWSFFSIFFSISGFR